MLSDIPTIYNSSLLDKKKAEGLFKMYSRHTSSSEAAVTTVSAAADTRLAVADILSTMANGSSTDNLTPTTYATLEGFSTGILTQTTPTLTPTTLRNIEQTFIELQSVPPTQIEHQNQAGFVPPVVHRSSQHQQQHQQQQQQQLHPPASVAQIPTATPTPSQTSSRHAHPSVSNPSYHNSNQVMTQKSHPPTTTDSWNTSGGGGGGGGGGNSKSGRQNSSGKGGRNMGGRKPSRTEKLSPEEEERRRVRRERNKMAAARCRKRRLDHTNLLVNETNLLEDKRNELQNEIQLLQSQKEELEFLLETHKVVCKIAKHHLHHHLSEAEDIKPSLEELNRALMASSPGSSSPSTYSSSTSPATSTSSQSGHQVECNWEKKTPITCENNVLKSLVQRPNSLPLTSTFVTPSLPPISTASLSNSNFKSSITEATGIAISTPSNGIFNFEALMDGGTGLTPINGGNGFTPVIPTCSTQQRSSSGDLSSPDSITPSKLVSL